MLLAAAVSLCGATRGAGEVERFLPTHTFLYGGVEKLRPGFEHIVALAEANLPFFNQGQLTAMGLGAMALEMELGPQATTPEAFARATGLDGEAPAGIAWVLTDPSYHFDRAPNENVLLILPVQDAARIEALLAEHVLPETFRETAQLCRGTVRRLEYACRRAARRQDGGPQQMSWDALMAAIPGLPKLRCPGGGAYQFGPDGKVTCSLHNGPEAPGRPEGPLTRAALGTKTIGKITVVGGRTQGVGYAITDTHIVFSNNMNVLEDAVAAATAEQNPFAVPRPRAQLASPSIGPAAGQMRGYMDTAVLFDIAERELRQELDRGRGSPDALRRLMALLDAPRGLTAEARILQLQPADAQRIALAATWNMQASDDATTGWLETPPSDLAAWKLLPKSSLLAFGANLARPVFSVLADVAMTEEPALGAAVRLVMAGAEGDGAFAFTRGVFADEMPNMVLILRVKDQAVMDAATDTWTAMLAKEMRAEQGVQQRTVGGVSVRSVVGREGASLHFARAGDFAVATTSAEDMQAVLSIQQGAADEALVSRPAYRKLELAGGPANGLVFADIPGLVGQFAEADHQRRVVWCNRNCRRNMERIGKMADAFQEKEGRFPANLKELTGEEGGVRRRYVPTTCHLSGTGTVRYVYDPDTGRVRCPRHGTLDAFEPVSADTPRRRGPEEIVISAFGVGALRLRFEDGQLKAAGALSPKPQRVAERGSM